MRLPKLTYANVMSTFAVFLALGGTSYAAVKLKKGSVTSREIKNGSLQADDLAPSAKFSGPRGPRGDQGPAGATGPKGDRGATGPADVVFRHHDGPVNFGLGAGSSVEAARFTVPAGAWVVTASANLVNPQNTSTFRCWLTFGGTRFGLNTSTDVGLAIGYTEEMTVLGAFSAGAPQTVVFTCSHDAALNAGSDLARVERIRVSAVRTENLDIQPL